jgi:hypothetical protein
MERVMSSLRLEQFTQNLRQTNEHLRDLLENLGPGQAHPATPQLICSLLSELRQAGEWLRTRLPEERDLQLRAEWDEYRRNLERLRDRMPAIHSYLLAERARLETQRVRIESAVEWAQGSRQTL